MSCTVRHQQRVDADFANFGEALAAHHALGHVNLGDGLSTSSVLDSNSGSHNVLSGYSSRCEMHWNPHTLSKKRRLEYEQLLQQDQGVSTAFVELEDGREAREKRYELSGTVTGLYSATASPCDIRSLAVRRGNYYGTPFYAEIESTGETIKLYNGSLFAPLPHVYSFRAEVGEMERELANGTKETVVVIRDILEKRVDCEFARSQRGICTVLSYVLGVRLDEANDILINSGYLQQPEVERPDELDATTNIGRTELMFLHFQQLSKALAEYDFAQSAGEADEKYQRGCSELHFGRTAHDERYRRETTGMKTTAEYEQLKRRMPPTKLALFCRHPETLHVFGEEYLRFLGGCEADGRGPFFSMDFLQGLNLTVLRELYWYVHNTMIDGDVPSERLHMSPLQRMFFYPRLAPRAPPTCSEQQKPMYDDPVHPEWCDLRLVSMPHPYTRRRAVLPMDELWSEYLMFLEPVQCSSQGYEAALFGVCVMLYGALKRAHYVDKNACLPRSHLLARFKDVLGGTFGDQSNLDKILAHSSRYGRFGFKNRTHRETMRARTVHWFRQALGGYYVRAQESFYEKLLSLVEPALDELCDPDKLGVLVEEHNQGLKEPVYYLMQPYMYERTIVASLEDHCKRFEYYRKFQRELKDANPKITDKVVPINPLVEATVLRGWDRSTVVGISQALKNQVIEVRESDAKKAIEDAAFEEYCRDARDREEMEIADRIEELGRALTDFETDIIRGGAASDWMHDPNGDDKYKFNEVDSSIYHCEAPAELMDECRWYFERYDPQTADELERMAYFGPRGAEVPPVLHPVCSEQLANFEMLGRSPILCINGQAGSGKSDLGMLMFAGAASKPDVDNVVGLAFMSAHCSTWQQKMSTDAGVRYPVLTIHQFMEWHAKTCTKHPHMPAELRLKAKAMWKFAIKENIPFFSAAAKNGNCQDCLLEQLQVVMIDEAGLLYDELQAQLSNLLMRCACRLVNETFIGDVNQLDPVQPGHPFFQLVASGLWNFFMQHSHRAEMLELVRMSRDVGSGDVHPSRWHNKKSTFWAPCSATETSLRNEASMIRRLMRVFTTMKLSYRDTMIVCHTRNECRQISNELDTHYLGQTAWLLGNEAKINFDALALSPVTKKLRYGTYFPGQLVLMKKHIPALGVCTNEILMVHRVLMGTYVRIPYAVMAQMRVDLWQLLVNAINRPDEKLLKSWPTEVREVFEEAHWRINQWNERASALRNGDEDVEMTPQEIRADPDTTLIAAFKGRYRVLLSSVQRENAIAQCREAWQHWLVALAVYKDQPQQVLAIERSRQLPGDWPPDGHSSLHWHPSSYAQRERRDVSSLLEETQFATSTNDAFPGDWVFSLQGVDVLVKQLHEASGVGAESESLFYRAVCETAVDLLLGIKHDLQPLIADPTPHMNPMLRVQINPGKAKPNAIVAPTEAYELLDAPPKKSTVWWTAETRTPEERQFIEECTPTARCVMMAIGEHEQMMRERVQDILAHNTYQQQQNTSGATTGSTVVLPPHLVPFADTTGATVDENDYVAFVPRWRAAHSKVQGPEEGNTLRFLQCVVRSTYGKLTRQSVVFIPCCEQFERYLKPASAVTFYAGQSKQVKNVIFCARYKQDRPTLYTSFTRTEERFFAVTAPEVLQESLKQLAIPHISFMYRKLAGMKELYTNPSESQEVQDALTLARHRQHEHSLHPDERQRLCFERQTPICALDDPQGRCSLGESRDAWLQSVA